MVLRKHLTSGRLKAVTQTGLDRTITFTIQNKDEMGVYRDLHLIIEMMGKYSNIILTDQDHRILDSIKHVSIDTSSKRQILPGSTYRDIGSGKLDPLTSSYEDYLAFDKGPGTDLLQLFEGISKQYSAEILSRLSISPSTDLLSETQFSEITEMISDITAHPEPTIQEDSEGLPVFYSLMPFSAYEGTAHKSFATVNEMLEYYYGRREEIREIQQEKARLKKIVNRNLSHVQKLMKIHLEDTQNKDKIDRFLLYGELLSANIYQLKRGQNRASVLNYYTNEEIEIPMDPKLSPSSNVNSYFKRASKLKTAASISAEKYENEKAESVFLENLIYDIDSARNMEDLKDIQNILINYKYIDTDSRARKVVQKDPLEDPYEYTTSTGKKVLVGRNSRQNEVLTLKVAGNEDMWFHIKDLPGSHVILFTGNSPCSEQDIFECSVLAARHSKQNSLNKVTVDYTERKNVWKERGQKMGMVLYRNYRTIVVDPSSAIGVK